MDDYVTIELKGLRFYAEHGLYAEEQKVANEFELDIQIKFNSKKKIITELNDTIDYVTALDIVREEMNIRQQLLETCVMKISDRIYQKFTQVDMIKISLRKITPPITNFIGSVGVSYTKFYK